MDTEAELEQCFQTAYHQREEAFLVQYQYCLTLYTVCIHTREKLLRCAHASTISVQPSVNTVDQNFPAVLAASDVKFKMLSKTVLVLSQHPSAMKKKMFFSFNFKSRKYHLDLVLFGRSSTCPLTTMSACSRVRVRLKTVEPLIFVPFPLPRPA